MGLIGSDCHKYCGKTLGKTVSCDPAEGRQANRSCNKQKK